MNRYDEFFEKVINNKVLLDNLLKIKEDTWWELSYKERVNAFRIIIDEITSFYPELGKPKFDFILLGENQSGEDSKEGTYLNVKMIEDGNPFEILAAALHELRHYYQRTANEMYEKTGEVHRIFTKEEFDSFNVNLARSMLFVGANYIECSDGSEMEYKLQPIEYDAESFSYEFMTRFKEKYLTDILDITNCEAANLGFGKVKKLHEGNEDDIIKFSDIYHYEYLDFVNNNKAQFMKDKHVYEKFMRMLDKLYYLNDEQIFMLLNPAFLDKYDAQTKVNIINAYLEFNNSEERIIFDEDGYYFKGLLVDTDEEDAYKLMEEFFIHVADLKIKSICSKKDEDIKNSIERDIKINLSCEENVIKEENNPLLYKLQPYMLFKQGFIRDEYLKLINGIDKSYNSSDMYFMDFVRYLKKYDRAQLVKKAEILYGKDFIELYNEMLDKMKHNLEKGNKTIK